MVAVAPSERSRAGELARAIHVVIEDHRAEIDADEELAAVRLEVRFKPDGEVRRVMIERSSEYTPSA